MAAQVRRDGPMRFDRYMEQALYAPGLGYYERAAPVFGADGDFVTAPELGGFFAHCVARFCDFALEALDADAVAEYGPGTGTLARDVLAAARRPIADYWAIERSAGLRRRLPETLRQADALPKMFDGVVLANEFLDALPARCFEVADAGVRERMVAVRNGHNELHWTLQESEDLSAAVGAVFADLGQKPPRGYRSEWRREAYAQWLAELDGAMRRGLVLIVDYGYPRREYYHPQRAAGTLRCHAGHQAHADPLQRPGQQDISVDVDFTAVAELAADFGFEVLMFTTQAGFLLEYGLLEAMDQPQAADGRLAQRGEIETLTHPGRMGERFRVLALGRDFSADLPHDVRPDHRNRL